MSVVASIVFPPVGLGPVIVNLTLAPATGPAGEETLVSLVVRNEGLTDVVD